MITLETDKIYTVSQFEDILTESLKRGTCYKSKTLNYYNSICAFDIETSNIKLEADNSYKDIYLYNYLKGSKIRVSDVSPMKSHGLTFSREKGVFIDEFYNELCDLFPGSFESTYDEYEQVQNILKAMDINSPDDDKQKISIMYCWQFAIDGKVIFGRTWAEFMQCMEILKKYTDISKRILIFIHNMSFEFQWLKNLFQWHKVFAIAPRKPIYAVTIEGIEFRCSYVLTNYSLAKLGDQLHHYDIAKLEGELNYSLWRSPKTPMNFEHEIRYCINDVLVVSAYIQECVLTEKFISRIPLTATGYCRRYTRKKCFYTGNSTKEKKLCHASYRELMRCLTIDGAEEYMQLRRCFMGGFTHCAAYFSGYTLKNIGHIDETSAYPYALISEASFPMSSARKVRPESREEFEEYLKYYCCIFDAEFTDIKPTYIHENYISASHCFEKEACVINNGRVVSAKRIKTTITEIDFDIIRKTYKYKYLKVTNMRIYRRGYLPKNLILAIIKLYQDKTQLKDVERKEAEYQNSKALLNAVFGMMCTDIVKDEILYTDGGVWDTIESNMTPEEKNEYIEKCIEKYNRSPQRFLYYPWGVYCTAISRRNLFTGIVNMMNEDGSSDYVYADTDSIFCRNLEKHMGFIDKYNARCAVKLKRMCDYYDIDYNELLPRTIEGEIKPLGIWTIEHKNIDVFKSLGAKRYLMQIGDKISMTVAGVNKKAAVPYLLEKYGKEHIFAAFAKDLYIEPEHTGKLTHVYLDYYQSGQFTDYCGNDYKFTDEPPGVYLEAAAYYFDITQSYIDYLKGVHYSK